MIYTFTNITSQLDTISVTWVFSISIMLLSVEGRRCPWADVVLIRSVYGIRILLVIAIVSPGHGLDLLRAGLVCP